MRAQISWSCKFGFFLSSVFASLMVFMYGIVLVGSHLTMNDRNMGLLHAGSIVVGAGLIGTLLALPLTRLFSRQIGPGKYILGPGEDEGKLVEITAPMWVVVGYYNQLLHRESSSRKSGGIFLAALALMIVPYLCLCVFAWGRTSAHLRARYNILNAPAQGRLNSIALPGTRGYVSTDKVHITLDGQTWTASTDQVSLIYDSSVQELFDCSKRLNQDYLLIRGVEPQIKLEKLGPRGAASGDNREVIKLSLLE